MFKISLFKLQGQAFLPRTNKKPALRWFLALVDFVLGFGIIWFAYDIYRAVNILLAGQTHYSLVFRGFLSLGLLNIGVLPLNVGAYVLLGIGFLGFVGAFVLWKQKGKLAPVILFLLANFWLGVALLSWYILPKL